MALAYEIVHSLPGRMRLRLEAIYHKPRLAAGLEELLRRQPGVSQARVNANAASVTVHFLPGGFEPGAWLERLSPDDIPARIPHDSRAHGRLKRSSPLLALRRKTFEFECLVPPKVQCALSIVSLLACWLEAPLFITRIAVIAAVSPIFNRAVQTGLDDGKIGADALDSTSCLLLVWQGHVAPAALMTFLISLGELMRDEISQGCERLFAHQLELGNNSAWLINGHRRVRTPVSELKHGDHVAVYAGELIPVVGRVCGGEGIVVPATPEMDFEPIMVRTGDSVGANLVLTEGKLYIESEQGGVCPLFDPILHKESRRWLQRTRLHKQALHMAHHAILPLLSAAVLLFVITRDIRRAIAVITFDFITGVKIAIPTAVLSSMYKAGSRGVVIRNADALERLSKVNAIVFARGGALTALKPEVTEILVCDGYTMDQVTRLSAAVVQRYNHLGASAIIKYANLNKIPVPERTGSTAYSNLGVSAQVEGQKVFVGSTCLFREESIDLSSVQPFLEKSQKRGDTRACVAIDGKIAAVIAYRDPIRDDAKEVVAALKGMGINEFAVVSSGGEVAAQLVADKAGIANVHYRALPDEQANIVRGYKRRGFHVAVVGHDSANTLALEQADVAISLETGADVAVHRADVVLTGDQLGGLVEGIEIAREGMSLARQNLTGTIVSNVTGLVLSFFDKLEFLAATWVNNGSVILAAGNGLRPLLDHQGEDESPNGDGSSQ
jgi:Cu2+-exporting ATPase